MGIMAVTATLALTLTVFIYLPASITLAGAATEANTENQTGVTENGKCSLLYKVYHLVEKYFPFKNSAKKQLKAELDKKDATLRQQEADLNQLNTELEQQKNDLARKEDDMVKNREELAKSEEDLAKIRKYLNEMHDKIKNLKNVVLPDLEMVEQDACVPEDSPQVTEITVLELVVGKTKELKNERDHIENERTNLASELSNVKTQLTEANGKLDGANDELAQAKTELETAKANADLAEKVKAFRKKFTITDESLSDAQFIQDVASYVRDHVKKEAAEKDTAAATDAAATDAAAASAAAASAAAATDTASAAGSDSKKKKTSWPGAKVITWLSGSGSNAAKSGPSHNIPMPRTRRR